MNQAEVNVIQQPLVSIRCLVYNHEPFLRDCLEGFVMQQTNFPFEAIVHDDASTDRSADIIREYAAKYPHIIKPIYEKENLYSKKDGSLKRALDEAMSGSSKYVAYCEGDDYWTDPQKLQKQVDFMEAHLEYSMCFHNAVIKWERNENTPTLFCKLEERTYSSPEIYASRLIPTAAILLKKSVLTSDIYEQACSCFKGYPYGDTLLFLSAAAQGKLMGFPDVMSVYRKHEGGIAYHRCLSPDSLYIAISYNQLIPKYFGSHLKAISEKRISNLFREEVLTTAKQNGLQAALKYMWGMMKRMPLRSLKFICTEPFFYLARKLGL